LMIDVTVIGAVKRRQALTRAGARPGDDLYVSGVLGSAAAGLAILRNSTTGSKEANTDSAKTNREHGNTSDLQWSPSGLVSSLTERYLRPEPRVRLGVHLGRNRAASACIDLSDGLADGAHRIAEASGVGV